MAKQGCPRTMSVASLSWVCNHCGHILTARAIALSSDAGDTCHMDEMQLLLKYPPGSSVFYRVDGQVRQVTIVQWANIGIGNLWTCLVSLPNSSDFWLPLREIY